MKKSKLYQSMFQNLNKNSNLKAFLAIFLEKNKYPQNML